MSSESGDQSVSKRMAPKDNGDVFSRVAGNQYSWNVWMG